MKTLVRPPRLDLLPDSASAPALAWAEAVRSANASDIINNMNVDRADHSFGESVLATFSEEAQLIGDDYRRWSAAGELCLLNRKGLIESDAKRHSGRGGRCEISHWSPAAEGATGNQRLPRRPLPILVDDLCESLGASPP